jgi:hypothetical protein
VSPQGRAIRMWLVWTLSFLAFPLAGLAGLAAVSSIDSPEAALAGGAVTGAVIGLAQGLLSSRRLPVVRWTIASAVGTSVGLAAGGTLVGFGTSLGELVVMGAATGMALGLAQCWVLPRRAAHRWVWAAAMPAIWAAGWTVTTLFGVDVDRHYTTFGATGALTVSLLTGMLLGWLLPPSRSSARPLTSGDVAREPARSRHEPGPAGQSDR